MRFLGGCVTGTESLGTARSVANLHGSHDSLFTLVYMFTLVFIIALLLLFFIYWANDVQLFTPGSPLYTVTPVTTDTCTSSRNRCLTRLLAGELNSATVTYLELNRYLDNNELPSSITAICNDVPYDLVLLAKDGLKISDLTDIITYEGVKMPLRLHVGGNEAGLAKELMMVIIRELNLTDEVKFTDSNDFDLYATLVIGRQPAEDIVELSKSGSYHAISVSALNSGQWSTGSDQEKHFYAQFPGVVKATVDISKLIPQVYPYLSLLSQNDRFIYTIRLNRVILCTSALPDYNVLKIMKEGEKAIGLREMANIYPARIPIREISKDVYSRNNLIVTENDLHCVNYQLGYCPAKEKASYP